MSYVTKYTSFDRDDSISDAGIWGNFIDIEGEDYRRLISTCFKYSTCFSLIFRANDKSIPYSVKGLPYEKQKDFPEYDQFVIKRGVSDRWPGKPRTGLIGEIRYYSCCAETIEMLYKISNSIFKFEFSSETEYNPEDLCFFRSDGTVLFAMDMHEGECYLFPRNDEDFEEVFAANPWFEEEYPLDWYNKYYNDLAVFMEKEDFLRK